MALFHSQTRRHIINIYQGHRQSVKRFGDLDQRLIWVQIVCKGLPVPIEIKEISIDYNYACHRIIFVNLE